MPYSKAGDPAGAGPEETTLKIRALLVDGRVSEWTTGDAHDVTDRSFVVRRALRINDSLPNDRPGESPQPATTEPLGLAARPVAARGSRKRPCHGPQAARLRSGQRARWLVSRLRGLLRSNRDGQEPLCSRGADWGAQARAGEEALAFDAENHPWPVCELPEWQREPLKVTFHPAGRDPAGLDLVGGSAVAGGRERRFLRARQALRSRGWRSMESFDELLRQAEFVHGHMCAGQILGVRMALLACRRLGVDAFGFGKRRRAAMGAMSRCLLKFLKRSLRIEIYAASAI